MSRRKLQWKRRVQQAGSIDKVLPRLAKGEGTWRTKAADETTRPSVGTGKGATVTQSISTRKEQLVRSWAK